MITCQYMTALKEFVGMSPDSSGMSPESPDISSVSSNKALGLGVAVWLTDWTRDGRAPGGGCEGGGTEDSVRASVG